MSTNHPPEDRAPDRPSKVKSKRPSIEVYKPRPKRGSQNQNSPANQRQDDGPPTNQREASSPAAATDRTPKAEHTDNKKSKSAKRREKERKSQDENRNRQEQEQPVSSRGTGGNRVGGRGDVGGDSFAKSHRGGGKSYRGGKRPSNVREQRDSQESPNADPNLMVEPTDLRNSPRLPNNNRNDNDARSDNNRNRPPAQPRGQNARTFHNSSRNSTARDSPRDRRDTQHRSSSLDQREAPSSNDVRATSERPPSPTPSNASQASSRAGRGRRNRKGRGGGRGGGGGNRTFSPTRSESGRPPPSQRHDGRRGGAHSNRGYSPPRDSDRRPWEQDHRMNQNFNRTLPRSGGRAHSPDRRALPRRDWEGPSSRGGRRNSATDQPPRMKRQQGLLPTPTETDDYMVGDDRGSLMDVNLKASSSASAIDETTGWPTTYQGDTGWDEAARVQEAEEVQRQRQGGRFRSDSYQDERRDAARSPANRHHTEAHLRAGYRGAESYRARDRGRGGHEHDTRGDYLDYEDTPRGAHSASHRGRGRGRGGVSHQKDSEPQRGGRRYEPRRVQQQENRNECYEEEGDWSGMHSMVIEGKHSSAEADWQKYATVPRQRPPPRDRSDTYQPSSQAPPGLEEVHRPEPSASAPPADLDPLQPGPMASFEEVLRSHSGIHIDWSEEVEKETTRIRQESESAAEQEHSEPEYDPRYDERQPSYRARGSAASRARAARGAPAPSERARESRGRGILSLPPQATRGVRGAYQPSPLATSGYPSAMATSPVYPSYPVQEPDSTAYLPPCYDYSGTGDVRGPGYPLATPQSLGGVYGGVPGRGGASRYQAPPPQQQMHLPPRLQRNKWMGPMTGAAGRGGGPPIAQQPDPVAYRGVPTGRLHIPPQENVRVEDPPKPKMESQLMSLEHEIVHLTAQLHDILQRVSRSGTLFNETNLLGLRAKLFTLYRNYLPLDLDHSFSNNLEQRMWKDTFYVPIETMRQILHDCERLNQPCGDPALAPHCEAILGRILEESTAQYVELITRYQSRFNFSLEEQLYETVGLQLTSSHSLKTSSHAGVTPSEMDAAFPPLGGAPRSSTATTPREGVATAPQMTKRLGGLDEHLASGLVLKVESKGHMVKVALLSCQRFLIALGDLSRYRSQLKRSGEFSEARKWYLKAVQLGPNNGRVYNQLALLAHYTRRSLDSVYYYVRALAAKHRFDTASQSVLQHFSECQKKVSQIEGDIAAQLEQARKQEYIRKGRRAEYYARTTKGGRRRVADVDFDDNIPALRKEIWIGGSTEQGDETESTEGCNKSDTEREIEELLKAGTSTLYKRMIVYFLHSAGMLFTKIGMDNFEPMAEKALRQLAELLRHRSENPLTAMQLVKIVTIALFCVHNAAKHQTEKGTCSLVVSQAVQMVLSLWGILLEEVNQRMHVDYITQVGSEIPIELERVLPAVRILSSWFSLPLAHVIYSELPTLNGLDTERFRHDIWHTLASLCNRLQEMEQNKILSDTLKGPKGEFSQGMILPEELCTTSFFQVYESKPPHLYIPEGEDLTHWALKSRLYSIITAGEFLHGMELPCFYFDKDLKRFVSLTVPNAEPTSDLVATSQRRETASDEELESGTKAEEPLSPGSELPQEMQRLQLQRQEERDKQAALEAEAQTAGLILEITPQVLVPDTNAFIDCLGMIKQLVAFERYTVAVPVVVINELKGLTLNEDDWLASQSRNAYDYLQLVQEEQGLPGKRKTVQFVTTLGNAVPALTYTTEVDSSGAKEINDDRILQSCEGFCKDDDNRGEIRDLKVEAPKLKRKVVLLTQDRALRIKAMSKNIPVRSLESFMAWARIATT